MKFSSTLSSLVLLLPVVLPVAQVAAVPALLGSDEDFVLARALPGKFPAKKSSSGNFFQGAGSKSSAKAAPAKATSAKASASSAKAPPASLTATKATASAATVASSSSAAAVDSSTAAADSSTEAASGTAIAAAATSSAAAASASDLQTSLTLDPSQVQPGLAQDGQNPPVAGQIASATSTNNFINFCAQFPELPLTNGEQVITGSCNPTPMGIVAAKANIPSQKIINPPNFSIVQSNTTIAFKIAVANMETGNFVDADTNYFAAPQTVNSAGLIVAHSHIVVSSINGLQDTVPSNPSKFNFFKGLNDAAVDGILEADATGGLPAGTYRACTMGTSANHTPMIVAVAQHDSCDDCTYFIVADDVAAATASLAAFVTGSSAPAAAATAAASSTAVASAATASAATASAATSSAAAAKATTAATKASSAATPKASTGAAGAKTGAKATGGKKFPTSGRGRGRGRGRF